ncbi:MAG: LamG domain-containing protein, partial [Candidatus Marinimicrobia bacterium]|nr:LamG domain-containing protein [Candidatus Neomarinimicrobiota bacterium]
MFKILLLLFTFTFAQNYSLQFDGVDDYVDLGNFGIATTITVIADINLPPNDEVGVIICKDNQTSNIANRSFALGKNADNQAYFRVFDDSDTIDDHLTISSNQIIADNQPHLIVATWNGNLVNIYIDGILDVSEVFEGTLNITDQTLFFGRTGWPQTPSYRSLSGLINEIAIYNYAMTESQINNNPLQS